MNLLLIGYCHLADGFLYASQSLEKFNYKIYFFPYTSYIMDKIEERDDILVKYINDNDIDICLWWNNMLKYDNFERIFIGLLNKNLKNIFYNWDPFLYNYKKYSSFIWEERIDERKKIYSLMDCVFSCFETEINYFKNNIKMIYAPPGFNKNISKYIYDEDYQCDISIVCTNLYDNIKEFPPESTNITRYEIVDKLYELRNEIKFNIYGLEKFKEKYPECYKGFINYENCNKVFSNSKINLSIHPLVRELNNEGSYEEYFSERMPQILGSNGLLVTNSYFNHKLNENIDYIYIDKYSDWVSKLLKIINNDDDYNIIRENGYNKAIDNYQWDHWAKIINDFI